MVLTSDRRLKILDASLSPKLAEFGVLWRKDGNWVEPGDIPIRRVIKFALLKGTSAVIEWGLSLTFVPAVSGSQVIYHRTWRAARLDLFEYPESYRRSFSGLRSFERVDCRDEFFEPSLIEYFHRIAPEIAGWFERNGTIEAIEQELEAQVRSQDCAYRVHHPRPLFVLAFLKAAKGDLALANNMLTESLDDNSDAETVAALLQALAKSQLIPHLAVNRRLTRTHTAE
jgi:hypothetical protein